MSNDERIWTVSELYIEALHLDHDVLARLYNLAVSDNLVFKEQLGIALSRMTAAETERDKLRERLRELNEQIRELMGLASYTERQRENDGTEG